MAYIDPFEPLKRVQDFKDYDVDRDKYYYIAFFNNGKLDTRPLKITKIYTVNSSSADSKYLRTEAEWEYHFETEKSVPKKVFDTRWWAKMLNINTHIVEQKVTEKWKIEYDKEWDTIDFYLIGETPHNAKLRLIMAALKTPYPKGEKSEIINKEMEYYQENHPDLVMKAMDFRIDEQYGDITDYSDKFLKIDGDLRNGI